MLSHHRSQSLATLTHLPVLVALTVSVASSILAPFNVRTQQHFAVSTAAAQIPQAVFLLGLSLAPFTGAARDCYGRKIILLLTIPLFAIFTVVCALVDAYPAKVIARFFAGLFASSSLAIGPAVLCDVWAAGQRTVPITLYVAALAVGAALAAVLGNVLVKDRYQPYRWTQFVVLFGFAACIATIVCMRETSKTVIQQRRRAKQKRHTLGLKTLGSTVTSSLCILVRQPAVWMSSISLALNTGVLYALLTAISPIFSTSYAFDWASRGLVFLSLVVGTMVGLLIFALIHIFYYQPRRTRWEERVEAEVGESTHRGHRGSRRRSPAASHRKRMSAVSKRSLIIPQTRHSSMVIPSRRSTPAASRENLHIDTLKNTGLAVAAAKHINAIPANADRRIMPERILLALNKNPTFGDICDELAKHNLTFDRVQLAKALTEAIPTKTVDSPVHAPPQGGPTEPPQPLARKDIHRAAAFAALEAAKPPSVKSASMAEGASKRLRAIQQDAGGGERPPPEWRLATVLPGTLVAAAGLFLTAWTAAAAAAVPWIVPVVGLALFAAGSLLVSVGLVLYLTDRFGAADIVHALAAVALVGYAVAFAFSMFALQMYDDLGVAWATTVLAFVVLLSGVPPCILLLTKSRLGRSEVAEKPRR